MFDLKDIVRWFYWYPFRYIIQLLPLRAVYVIGKYGGIILSALHGKRLKLLKGVLPVVINENIRIPKQKEIIRRALILFCQNELEVLLYPKMTSSIIQSTVECKGLDYLDEALKKGKGAMLLFAHFGANQMIMPAIGYRGYKMCQLSASPLVWTEKLPNKKFSVIGKKALEIRWEHELSLPVKHINIFGSLKEAFLCLKRNEILGVAVDGGGGKNRVAVNFLGKKALFSTGAMEIAARVGCSVLATFMIRDKDGHYTLIIEPPLRLVHGDGASAIQRNIALFVERLEYYVLKCPCHYLNFLALRSFMTEQGYAPFFITEGKKYEDFIDTTAVYKA